MIRRRVVRALLGLCVSALVAAPAVAQTLPQTHVLIVSGLGGEPEYTVLFREQAGTIVNALQERWGLPPENVHWLSEDPAETNGRSAARSTREEVERTLRTMAERAGSDDGVLLIMLGHGSGQGDESRINLPGPDLSGGDLAVWLAAFPTQTVAVVNAASASGGFVPALKGPRRIVITATRSARERERTYFGSYFASAFAREDADMDKDERVSLLEAFLYAKNEVERYYELENQMRTEHALLDDNGDGEGSLDPSADGPDGLLADRFFVSQASAAVAAAAADDPELAALLARKLEIENSVAELRTRRDEMTEEAFDLELETLMLDLARVSNEIRDRGGQ